MAPSSTSRVKQAFDAAQKLGVENAAEKLGLTPESVRRYCRVWRERMGASNPPGNPAWTPPDRDAPRVLIFDIETAPNLAWVWKCYDENVSPAQMVNHGYILCYAAKWLGNDAVAFDSCREDKDDERVCRTLWQLFDKADIIVAHNGIAFDSKTMNTRWVKHGLPPPSPHKVVDTLKIARGVFRFPMNKLDYVARYLGIGRKVPHEGFELWVKCMAGDAAAWQRMEEYNVQDVLLLEEVYMRLRPWDKRHPNVALMYQNETQRCVCCGSTALVELAKTAYTAASAFPAMRCQSCGKVMRSREREKREEKTLANVL